MAARAKTKRRISAKPVKRRSGDRLADEIWVVARARWSRPNNFRGLAELLLVQEALGKVKKSADLGERVHELRKIVGRAIDCLSKRDREEDRVDRPFGTAAAILLEFDKSTKSLSTGKRKEVVAERWSMPPSTFKAHEIGIYVAVASEIRDMLATSNDDFDAVDQHPDDVPESVADYLSEQRIFARRLAGDFFGILLGKWADSKSSGSKLPEVRDDFDLPLFDLGRLMSLACPSPPDREESDTEIAVDFLSELFERTLPFTRRERSALRSAYKRSDGELHEFLGILESQDVGSPILDRWKEWFGECVCEFEPAWGFTGRGREDCGPHHTLFLLKMIVYPLVPLLEHEERTAEVFIADLKPTLQYIDSREDRNRASQLARIYDPLVSASDLGFEERELEFRDLRSGRFRLNEDPERWGNAFG